MDNIDIDDPYVKNLLREFNEEHLAVVKGDSNYTFILNPITYHDGWYID